MIAMSMLSTYDEYRRDRLPLAPASPFPEHPLRRALKRALARIGVGGAAGRRHRRAGDWLK
jgi:hypothetical protein